MHRQEQLVRRLLLATEQMVQGGLSETARRCGNPNCICQRDPERLHGPHLYITYHENGKSCSLYVRSQRNLGPLFDIGQRLKLLRDVPILAVSSEILRLAEDLITEGPIPRKAAGDADHIAIATVYGCEYLLTWNCRHIANAELHRPYGVLLNNTGT